MGCVYFVPAPGFEAHGNPTSYPGNSTSKGSNSYPIDMEPGKLQRLGCQGPAINLENLSWRVLNRPFVSVWLHNVPWGAENTKAAPDAKVGFLCQNLCLNFLTLYNVIITYY